MSYLNICITHLGRIEECLITNNILLQIAGSMMGTQPLPPHQQPGGGGPLGLKKQQEFLGRRLIL